MPTSNYTITIPAAVIDAYIESIRREFIKNVQKDFDVIDADLIMVGAEFCMKEMINGSTLTPLDVFMQQVIYRSIEKGSKGITLKD